MQIIPTVSPILIDGTGVSKKCGTLARVRAHRARQASLYERHGAVLLLRGHKR